MQECERGSEIEFLSLRISKEESELSPEDEVAVDEYAGIFLTVACPSRALEHYGGIRVVDHL